MRERAPRDTQASHHCGFVSAQTTSGLAAYALRIHSCQRWQALTASRVHGAELRALRGTVVRECSHDGRHPHGDRNRYVLDQCRCDACRKAATAYERMRIRQSAYGRWQPYVDAEPARQHVRALMVTGLGWQRVARLAGVSTGGVSKLLYGAGDRNMAPSKRIRPETARRLLAVTGDSKADAALTPARPTWRLIEGLVALGYSKVWIAVQIGQQRALQLDRDFVLIRTARNVEQLAERVGDTPGPSVRARHYAVARGWLVPAYGTDEEIAEQARLAVEINREEREQRRLDVARLTAAGLSAAAIAQTLDIGSRQVTRDRASMRVAS